MATKLKLPKPLVWLYPLGIQRQYQRVLKSVVKEWEKQAINIIIGNLPRIVNNANTLKNKIATNIISDSDRQDNYVEDVDNLMNEYELSLLGLTPLLPNAMSQTVQNVSAFNNVQWKKIIKHSLKIDYFNQEPWLIEHTQAFVRNNISLIQKLQQKTTENIREVITTGIMQGKRHNTIADEILQGTDLKKGIFNKASTRAKLIARDQVNKVNGQFQELRQTDIGVTRYIWRTSQDERVRTSHKNMDGRTCVWHNSTVYIGSDNLQHPRSGIKGVQLHVGQDIQCRCNASPDFSSIKDLDLVF